MMNPRKSQADEGSDVFLTEDVQLESFLSDLDQQIGRDDAEFLADMEGVEIVLDGDALFDELDETEIDAEEYAVQDGTGRLVNGNGNGKQDTSASETGILADVGAPVDTDPMPEERPAARTAPQGFPKPAKQVVTGKQQAKDVQDSTALAASRRETHDSPLADGVATDPWIPDNAGYELISEDHPAPVSSSDSQASTRPSEKPPAASTKGGESRTTDSPNVGAETGDATVDQEAVEAMQMQREPEGKSQADVPTKASPAASTSSGMSARLWAAVGFFAVVAGAIALYAFGPAGDDGTLPPPQHLASRVERAQLPARSTPNAIEVSWEEEPIVKPNATGEPPSYRIGIACSSEKLSWLKWAVREFTMTEEGRLATIDLIPMESLESSQAIVDGDERIHVWAPACSLYQDTFTREWKSRYAKDPDARLDPIIQSEQLALTPMVIIMWKERYQAFADKAPDVSFKTIGYAMHAETGWEAIAGKPSWGHFKLSHTNPMQSNSGVMALLVLAGDFCGKRTALAVADVMEDDFQQYLAWFGQGVSKIGHSTSDLIKEMVLRGPSEHDAVIVYEATAIDYLEKAKGRWDAFQAIYPKYNVWNDNPYYILDTPWSSKSQQAIAADFLDFLMSETAQQKALEHGFRPGNPDIPVKGTDSPFTRYAEYGFQVDLPIVCELPTWQVLENLQQSWLRNASPR